MGTNVSPSGASVTLSEGAGNTYKYLSGVPWLTTGDTINIASTCSNVAMKSYRNSNALYINWSDFGKSNQWFGADTIFNGVPNKADGADISTSSSPMTSFSIDSVNTANENSDVTCTYYDPHGASSGASDDSGINFRVDTFAPTYNETDLIDIFSGETKRFTSNAVDSYLYDNGVTQGNADWNSSADISSAVGGELSLQVGLNDLMYPTSDYSSTVPVGPNYSGLTGDRTYYRLFVGTGPYNGGTIRLGGLTNALSEVQSKTNIEVYLHLPGVATYQYGGGFENGSIFQDLGTFQNIPGGCLAFTGGTGEYVDFSFGTTSSTLSNYKCFIKVKIKNSSVKLTRVDFTPSYA